MPGDVDLDDLPYEDILSGDEELEMKKEREDKKRLELLAKVDFSRYTDGHTVGYAVRQQNKTESRSRQKCCHIFFIYRDWSI